MGGQRGKKRTLNSFLHPKIHHAKLTHTKVVEGIMNVKTLARGRVTLYTSVRLFKL